MRRALKILGFTVGSIVLLLGLVLAYFSIKGIPSFEVNMTPETANLKVPRDSASVARGAKIASLLCGECHRDAEGNMTGKIMSEVPKPFGVIASRNITQHPEIGIGRWTDGELYYFLRTGIRQDGSWAPPFMPKLSRMADTDVYAIIAWLRSDDPRLAPNTREYPPNKYNLLSTVLANTLFSPPAFPDQPLVIPDSSNQVALGQYIANDMLECFACHSGDMMKVDSDNPAKSFGYYGGGIEMQNHEGEIVRSANITMDKQTGIGNWTEQQFVEAVKYGKNPRGGALQYPMSPHTALSDAEVRAIFAFLKTVPVQQHAVERYQPKITSR
ncbi:MAG: cytochrome c [Saprospiraceae bacterium]|nr:cytochrome c [Saprospiraceae bacterium]